MRPLATSIFTRLLTGQSVLSDTVGNYLRRVPLTYVVEPINWAIKSVGEDVVRVLNQQRLVRARLSTSARGLRQTVIHYGSVNTLLARGRVVLAPRSCRTIATIFHVLPRDPRAPFLAEIGQRLDRIHTVSTSTQQALIDQGVPAEKIHVIPLGIDLDYFKPVAGSVVTRLRQQLQIPSGHYVIGSFQKDGNGWGRGETPKWEKGPDILVAVAKELARELPVYVLLVGPARGYVVAELQAAGIPFAQVGYLRQTHDVIPYYALLDAYVITARVEGGPRQLLEAWASRVPVVSTRVGMVPDVATHQTNALLAPVEDVATLTAHLMSLHRSPTQRAALIAAAAQEVRKYDWPVLMSSYYEHLYRPLLEA